MRQLFCLCLLLLGVAVPGGATARGTAARRSPLACAYAAAEGAPVGFVGQVGADCTATLTWQTTTERTGDGPAYEVQASANGKTWVVLGTVPSQTQAAGARYTYRAGALAGTRYYRLRLAGAGGPAAYSPVVALTAMCELAPLQLVPNPVRDYALVSGLPPGRSQLLLYNASGQRVWQTTAEGSARLILSGLPAGLYLLKVVAADGALSSTTRVVKE